MRSVGAVLLVIAAIALPSLGSAQQKLYKWTDENGVVHYSDSIPPVEPRDIVPLEPYRYRSAPDIEDPGDRRLELLESQVKLTEADLGALRKKLVDLQAEASNYKPYSTREDAPPIPENLALDISRTTKSIALYEQTLARTRAAQEALKQSFDRDIARFIEVTGE